MYPTNSRFCAILLSAGGGKRTKAKLPKQYNLLGGQAILNYSLKTFIECNIFNQIIIVIQNEYKQLCLDLLGNLAQYVKLVEGGKTRQESTFKGLQALKSYNPDYVYIHDAARPFVSKQQIYELSKAVTPKQGAILALPIQNTIKRVTKENYIEKTIERENLYSAQTPQVFPYNIISLAHAKSVQQKLQHFTDDSQLAEWHNLNVKIVPGHATNIKITLDIDFTFAQEILKQKDK